MYHSVIRRNGLITTTKKMALSSHPSAQPLRCFQLSPREFSDGNPVGPQFLGGRKFMRNGVTIRNPAWSTFSIRFHDKCRKFGVYDPPRPTCPIPRILLSMADLGSPNLIGGVHKWWYHQNGWFLFRKILLEWMIWGYLHLWKRPI